MPRKNNPARTVENILAVSAKLFVEKGYERACMTDIVREVGMSKGAIFHHFKSKEDIFNAVMERQFDYALQLTEQWLDELDGLCGREKLRVVIERTVRSAPIGELDGAITERMLDHRFLIFKIQQDVKKSAPRIAEVIREGVADGSLQTEYPNECAEVFLVLLNTWCDHVLFKCDAAQLLRRFKFLQHTLERLGVDIISDELVNELTQITQNQYGGK